MLRGKELVHWGLGECLTFDYITSLEQLKQTKMSLN